MSRTESEGKHLFPKDLNDLNPESLSRFQGGGWRVWVIFVNTNLSWESKLPAMRQDVPMKVF